MIGEYFDDDQNQTQKSDVANSENGPESEIFHESGDNKSPKISSKKSRYTFRQDNIYYRLFTIAKVISNLLLTMIYPNMAIVNFKGFHTI